MNAIRENPCPQGHPIPFLKSDEEQIGKIRRQLEAMFRELRLVQDVIMVCGKVCEAVNSDFDDEVEHVLRRCASDRMYSVLKTLTQIVERFGGQTAMSDERHEETPVSVPEQDGARRGDA